MLVPGLNYNFETLVESISELGVADQIRVFVSRKEMSQPILTAVINMPVPEMVWLHSSNKQIISDYPPDLLLIFTKLLSTGVSLCITFKYIECHPHYMSCDSDYIRSCCMKFKSESGIRSTVHTDFYKVTNTKVMANIMVDLWLKRVAIPCNDQMWI